MKLKMFAAMAVATYTAASALPLPKESSDPTLAQVGSTTQAFAHQKPAKASKPVKRSVPKKEKAAKEAKKQDTEFGKMAGDKDTIAGVATEKVIQAKTNPGK